jgi:hypothetical protein
MANLSPPGDSTGSLPEDPAAGRPSRLDRKLAQAIRHVTEGRLIVARQRELVSLLTAKGHATAPHEQTLGLFESTLRLLEDHERLLRREIAETLGENLS